MVDQQNNEDEYQFSEDSDSGGVYDDADSEEIVQESGGRERNLKQPILIFFVVALVGFIGYKVITPTLGKEKKGLPSWHETTSSSSEVAAKSATMHVSTQQAHKRAKPQLQHVHLPKIIADDSMSVEKDTDALKTVKQGSAHVKSQLSELKTSSKLSGRRLNRLSGSVDDLKSGVMTINSRLSQLSQQLSVVTDTLRRQQELIHKMQQIPQVTHTPHSVVVKKLAPPPVYHIQALIPGRAWLISPTGDTLTVIQGSALPHYGKVERIDIENRQIYTTSGRVITFSVQDT